MELKVVKDTCLGHEVFRGSAPASEILRASWIDFHDPDSNPQGYQRPFSKERSVRAAGYAEAVADAFWPESILAIRSNEEVDDDDEKVYWEFRPLEGTEDRFGTLTVDFNADGSTLIADEPVPWRRAFAQVDCQHRLGSMGASSKVVTLCIFPDLSRHQEAVIFRTINRYQRKIDTSLVDTIILLTDPSAPPHIRWAFDLDLDAGSPFYRKVDTGGRGRTETLIKLSGLNQSLHLLIPQRLVVQATPTQLYTFARNYWLVVKRMWPTAFGDKKGYKLTTNPGIRGLSRFGREILKCNLAAQNFTQTRIRAAFADDPTHVNWSVTGPLKDATGKGAERLVFEYLIEQNGQPV